MSTTDHLLSQQEFTHFEFRFLTFKPVTSSKFVWINHNFNKLKLNLTRSHLSFITYLLITHLVMILITIGLIQNRNTTVGAWATNVTYNGTFQFGLKQNFWRSYSFEYFCYSIDLWYFSLYYLLDTSFLYILLKSS